MRFCPRTLVARCAVLLAAVPVAAQQPSGPRFAISFPAERAAAPLDGRLILILTRDETSEPRAQVSWGLNTPPAFAIDVEHWAPGTDRIIDATSFGFPVRSLSLVPKGTYHVQALINRYETFTRSDGHTVKVAPDKGEGQHPTIKPGNLYSTPRAITFDPASRVPIRITLDKEIPPIPEYQETKYVKHVRIRSERLSKFWGRDMFISAFVTLPWGFDEHPNAHYPLVINHGHFATEPENWRETPPDPDLKPDYSERFSLAGYNRIQQQYAWQLFQDWTGKGFPRMLMVQIQHPTPFYDDSYAVNSANAGPWGDAIQYELLPEIERRFRGLGQGWARFVFGGSTGGWESMAVQVFYPQEYNGAWIACPDPIDFRHYETVNIYSDTNAFFMPSPWKRTPRPAHRNYLGHVDGTVEETNLYEYLLGTHSRSSEQWDVWEATFSPVGADGYPARIFDKTTGTIDKSVAAYWKEHYDLSAILQRDWKSLAKLKGKLRIYVGDMDSYYLNDAVYEVEKFIKSAQPRRTPSSITVIATSTAGMATTRVRTPTRACAIRRCRCRGSSNASSRRPHQTATFAAGDTSPRTPPRWGPKGVHGRTPAH
ncbi:MAG: hypothetical protein U0163_20965 [Gemmatimonadaceae bacterium]